MIKILIVAHGSLAVSFKEAIEMFVGSEAAASIETLCMTPEKDADQFAAEAQRILDSSPNAQFIICSDLFGASPSNTCISVFRNAQYRLVTGLNLPMLLELMMIKDSFPLDELSERIMKAGQSGIEKIYLHM